MTSALVPRLPTISCLSASRHPPLLAPIHYWGKETITQRNLHSHAKPAHKMVQQQGEQKLVCLKIIRMLQGHLERRGGTEIEATRIN